MTGVFPPTLFPAHNRVDLSFELGDGPYLYGSDGRTYLDFFSGIAVTGLGHAHPHLANTARDYAERVWHTSNNFRIPEQERLATRLVDNSFADRVYFCSTGLEAAEGAIKLARRAQYAAGKPERVNIVTIEGAFHGRSLAGLAATNNPNYLEGFGPRTPGFLQVPFNDLDALKDTLNSETAAVMLEPIQGEGGVRPMPLEYIRAVRALCDDLGVLLIFDEVQCGIGRSGRLFAHEWSGVSPDIMMLAKGLGGGFVIGAILATEDVSACMVPGTHGSTFGGNPFATAIANAVLDVVLEPTFLPHIREMSELLRSELEALVASENHVFTEVRGAGLLLGLKCGIPNSDCVAVARNAGLITHIAGDNVLRLMPPLIIESRHIAEAISLLREAVGSLSKETVSG